MTFYPPFVLWRIFHQIVELRMCALSHRIREIPFWWEEERAVERWREEALEQAENDIDEQQMWKLTPRMVCFVSCLRTTSATLNSMPQGRLRAGRA